MWDCIAYALDLSNKRPKLKSKTIKSIFLGYAFNSKVYRFLNLSTNSIFKAINAEFFEHLTIKDAISLELDKGLGKEVVSLDKGKQVMNQQDPSPSKESSSNKDEQVFRSKRSRIEKDFGSDMFTYICDLEDDPKSYNGVMSRPDAQK